MIKIVGALAAAILLACSAVPAAAAAGQPAAGAAPSQIARLIGHKTRMRDGVQLVSDIWLPASQGRYPILLMRSPYHMRSDKNAPLAEYFARRGYAFVIQDVRGTGDSGGEFDFLFQEAKDGYDTIESLAKAPWSNGKLCTIGLSYMGSVQWLAAKEQPPSLKCMAPTAPAGFYHQELPTTGGALVFNWAISWLRMVTAGDDERGAGAPSIDWANALQHRPLITLDEHLGRRMRLYREFLTHDRLDAYWRRIDLTARDFARIDIPILKTTGWFDDDQPGALFYWRGMEARAIPARDTYLIIGPWDHGETFAGGGRSHGLLGFGADSIIDNKAIHLAFFDHYLKGDGARPDWPKVRLFVTGANLWRDFDRWPVTGVKERRLYLSSHGKANTRGGDGLLRWDPPGQEEADRYIYDPKNPVPLEYSGKRFGADRSATQDRRDVLVYTTAPLAKPVEIIGPVSVELFAASDTRDTDFTATVSDVTPDGKAVALGSKPVGIIRARYRGGREARPRLLTPGRTERYRIDLAAFGHRFLSGHRIRVEISSSAAPMFNPNQNTGNPIATDTEWKVARQTIFHDRQRPSALVLPVFEN